MNTATVKVRHKQCGTLLAEFRGSPVVPDGSSRDANFDSYRLFAALDDPKQLPPGSELFGLEPSDGVLVLMFTCPKCHTRSQVSGDRIRDALRKNIRQFGLESTDAQ